jgi:hypothetical protein
MNSVTTTPVESRTTGLLVDAAGKGGASVFEIEEEIE